MRIWELSPSEFHSQLAPNPGVEIEWASLVSGLPDLSEEPAHPLPHVKDFEYWIRSGTNAEDADIVVYEAATARPVAAKLGPTITTDPAFRRRRIGPAMIVALYEHYPWRPGTTFTVSDLGARAFRRAHALEVAAAYLRGDPVPKGNLEHYNLP